MYVRVGGGGVGAPFRVFSSRRRSAGPLPLAVTEFAAEPELVSGGTETAGRTFPGCPAGRSGGRWGRAVGRPRVVPAALALPRDFNEARMWGREVTGGRGGRCFRAFGVLSWASLIRLFHAVLLLC